MMKIVDGVLVKMTAAEQAAYEAEQEAAANAPRPVPSSVTNYQARAVMRMTPMPDGRSLLEAVRSALKADLDRVQTLPDMDPDRVAAEVSWEAWEQANVYERNGPLVSSLASRFGLNDAMTDDLFRQAEQVMEIGRAHV